MKSIVDYLKSRPVLAIAAGIGILLAFALALWLGAQLWQAIAALFGFGAGGAQIARTFAKKDAERIQNQAEIDEWKKTKLADLDQTRMRAEQKVKVELGKKHAQIDKSVETETSEQLRKRLLDSIKGPLQCILWGSLLSLMGCVHTAGTPDGIATRDVCFTKGEVGAVLKRIADLQAAIKSCQNGAIHNQTKASVECQALVARWQLEARTCSDKLTACSARTCPSCWLPWLIVGVSLTATAAVGIYAGVKLSGATTWH